MSRLNAAQARFEIYDDTARLAFVETNAIVTLDRQPSATCIPRFTLTGSFEAGNTLSYSCGPVQNESIPTEAAGVYFGSKFFEPDADVSGQLKTIIAAAGCTSILVEQYSKDRAPITQLVTASRFLYGDLRELAGGIEEGRIGQRTNESTHQLIVPGRWLEIPIAEKQWIKDGAGNYYRVESVVTYSTGKSVVLIKADP